MIFISSSDSRECWFTRVFFLFYFSLFAIRFIFAPHARYVRWLIYLVLGFGQWLERRSTTPFGVDWMAIYLQSVDKQRIKQKKTFQYCVTQKQMLSIWFQSEFRRSQTEWKERDKQSINTFYSTWKTFCRVFSVPFCVIVVIDSVDDTMAHVSPTIYSLNSLIFNSLSLPIRSLKRHRTNCSNTWEKIYSLPIFFFYRINKFSLMFTQRH